jgi:hypothetical protein
MIKVKNSIFVIAFLCILTLVTAAGCQKLINVPVETYPTILSATEEIQGIPSIIVITNDRSNNENQVFRLDKDFNVIESFPNTFGNLTISLSDCSLLNIWGFPYQFSIKTIDLQGRIIGQNELKFTKEISQYFQYRHLISPTGDWIAFKEASGEWGQSYASATYQDVKVVNLNRTTYRVPIKLTNHSGAFIDRLAWSPNGQYLTFTDFDDNGITQVFFYDTIRQEKNQVTQWQEQHDVQDIKWSLDSTFLSASIFDRQKLDTGYVLTNGELIIFSLKDHIERTANFSGQDLRRIFYWWGIDERLFAYTESVGQESGTLNWYDAENNVVETEIELTSLNIQNWVNYAFPLAEDLNRIGIIGGTTYIFDKSTGENWPIENPTIEYIFNQGFFDLIETSSRSLFIQSCNK